MPSETYRQDMIDRVVAHALAAAKASQDGKTHLVLGDGMTAQRLSLREGGYCARFVRQVYETGCEFGEGRWRYAAPSALEMCKKLADDKHEVTDGSLTPGDIVGINRNCGAYGHVALYVGKSLGKRKLLEAVSPGKTVEGTLGLIAGATVAACVFGYFWLPQIHWAHFLILGFVGGIIGQLGDLCESAIKRSHGKKDASALLPGHGGLLDRMDSLIFLAPFVYYYRIFVIG